MVALMKWSFEKGFLEYVNKLEEETHANLVENLAEAYSQNGDWSFLEGNHRAWKQIHRASIAIPEPENGIKMETEMRPSDKDAHGQRRYGPPGTPHHFSRLRKGRECVLDAMKTPLVHCRSRTEDLRLKEIVVDNQVVGYLGSAPRNKLRHRRDIRFSEKQTRFFVILGICIACVSILLAFPVARQLVRPVKSLADASKKLASGDYTTRIDVNSSDELGDLSRDFNSLAQTLEANEKARQQWIADISHELRTPLSVLRAEIESLQDGVRELNATRLTSLHNEVMNLNRLVNDLYELSMSDIGALNYQKTNLDVTEIMSRTINIFETEFEAKNISVDFTYKQGLRPVFADSTRLQQLFTNILMNSLRYTNDEGSIQIDISEEKSQMTININDSAPGVADKDLPQLFDRLFRVDASRNRQSGGTGLGLAICRNIVEAHSGTIEAMHSDAGGLNIRIELPLA